MKKVFLGLALLGYATTSIQADEAADSTRLVSLQEVEISSSRASYKTPVAYTNLQKSDIEHQNQGQDIPYLLLKTPSVVVNSDAGTGIGYTGFRIRGTDANRINVTTNGIPLNDAESHTVFWVNIPDFASSIQDLQVQRGVGTSTAGAGAFGASINMKTDRIANQAYGEFNSSYGAFETAKVNLKLGTGLLRDHWAFDARLSSIQSDGFIDRASVDLKSYFFQGAYYGENNRLQFITFGGKEETYHAWDGVPFSLWDGEPTGAFLPNRHYNPSGYMGDDAQGAPLYYDKQTDNYEQTHYQLHYLHRLANDWTLTAALHYTKGYGYYEEYKLDAPLYQYSLQPFLVGTTAVESSDLVRKQFLNNHFGGTVLSFNKKTKQADIHLGGAANRYVGDHYGQVFWLKNYYGNWYPPHEYYRGLGKKNDFNVYAKVLYTLLPQLSWYGDVQFRFIDYTISGQNDSWDYLADKQQELDIHPFFRFFNPKTGVFWQINSSNDAYASFAVAHREPNRNNYVYSGLNENPTSEKLLDYEWGYNYKSPLFSAGVNFYYMDYTNQLVLTGKTNEIGEPLSSNIPDSYRLGMEVVAGYKLSPWLQWDANLTLSKNRVRNYSEFVDTYQLDEVSQEYEWIGQTEQFLGNTPLSFSPAIVANNFFTFEHKQWQASLHSSYVGKQYIDNTGSNLRKIDPYFVSNLRVSYQIKCPLVQSLAVSVAAFNIFNEKYESHAWVYSGLYKDPLHTVRGDDFGYFPQAGAHLMASLHIKF